MHSFVNDLGMDLKNAFEMTIVLSLSYNELIDEVWRHKHVSQQLQ